MAKFVERLIPARTSDEASGEGEPGMDPEETSSAAARVAMYSASDPTGTKPHEEETPAALRAEDDRLAADYGKIGEHVASVLESARTAATKIRDDAREDARRVAERSRKEAAEMLAEARREVARLKAEAERLRSEAQRARREERQQADEYAAEVRRAAQAEAARIVGAAKEEAREHTRAKDERSRGLDRNIGLAEERLTQLVGGLRTLAGQLENVVAGKDPATPSDTARAGGSLDASLHASASAHTSGEDAR
ncbi:MAG TPA: hypothetical protein VE736_04620 [Gaiellaceae bacterium]|nr:hypothetical protein [Gaiellaceae bacterium]